MTKIHKLPIYIFILFSIGNFQLSVAQNEFYNNGGNVYLNSGSASSTPTLFINGNLKNIDGTLNNFGSFIELKGDFTNSPTTYHYTSTGIERLSGTANQTIYGTWNGTTLNQDQFYTLKINKATTAGEVIILDNSVAGNTVNVNANGSLTFESTNGIIRTQSTSIGLSNSTASGNYINTLFLQNSDPAKFSNYSWTNVPLFDNTGGASTKYIEGKLKLAVVNNTTYNFPVGVSNAYLDGMEGASVTFGSSALSTTTLTAYLRPANTASYPADLVTNGGNLFYDIGSVQGPFTSCVGTPDGHIDVAVIDNALTHEWMFTPDVNPGGGATFDLSVQPGSTLDNISWLDLSATPCYTASGYKKVKYTANAGRIGGDNAVGPTYVFDIPGVLGLFQKPNGNKLSNQTTFDRVRIFGTTISTNTSLPVELTSFTINPVNNTYFELNWATASEFNNKGFYLQRKTDNNTFENIAWIDGNGTTNVPHSYQYEDHNVVAGKVYYYRLQQVNTDQSFIYSDVLSGILNGAATYNVLSVVPNPTTANPKATIYMPEAGNVNIQLFDIVGKVAKAYTIGLAKGTNNNVDIDMTDLATATYIARFTFDNTIITKKIIKN